MSPAQTAQPSLKFIPHHYRDWVRRGGYALLPLLLRVRLRPWLPAGIWPVTCKNPEVLAKAFHQFQAGQIRLLMAFRHSQVDDPLCLAYLFLAWCPRPLDNRDTCSSSQSTVSLCTTGACPFGPVPG
ncbi:MAG: hypothetical protein LVS60_18325 [Nodosilinea sp. LVE1205-7]